ncbi:outer memrane protein OmpA-like protein [Phaeobacter piscinae]|uniref:Outer memrane protein OmpA-like protein n=1 Tax=Phaeobacter piscinae TaxID=1580596 RepID=A0AAN1GTB2_9RHOB|nr:OmpA family protein [Phaeobacter piscinae]ATG44604.1 outer memrane protein OmpA-like protein [Phaeobacter piscinae]AUR36918.1 outer memrane protein OmpA-like protein [Phaeobacter piscinae]
MIRRAVLTSRWLAPVLAGLFCAGLPLGVAAQGINLPAGARQLAERATALGSYAVPLGPASDDGVPERQVEGQILRRSWRVSGDSTVLQILAPLRAQLVAAGYELLYQCPARSCGGFDFRFDIEVIPAPDMTVDVSNYSFVSAEHPDGRIVTLLVSRSGNATFVQVIEVTPEGDSAPVLTDGTSPADGGSDAAPTAALPLIGAAELITGLRRNGRAVLADLEFETGAVTLGAKPYDSLTALAEFLIQNPDFDVLLVGHTDTVGSLTQNIAISERRADAVRRRLLADSAVDRARVAVAGAGFMAPLTTNLTPEGREANRRVEVVLIRR